MGIIYCATNLINGKKYVGKTIRTLEDRKREHKNGVCKNLIHYKIKKYGMENFKWIILEHCDNEEYLNEREIYYIDILKSLATEHGYNLLKDSGQSCSDGWPSGENHYINQMTEKEKDEGIKNNMCGKNHSHRKHCGSEEEYQKWLDQNKRGDNHSTKKRFSTEEEYQEGVDAVYRGNNHYTKKMTQEEYKEWAEKQSKAKSGVKISEETKRKMFLSNRFTTKGKNEYIIKCPDGNIYYTISISSFCKEYCELYNIKPLLSRHIFQDMANNRREKIYRGFGCEFFDKYIHKEYISGDDLIRNKIYK